MPPLSVPVAVDEWEFKAGIPIPAGATSMKIEYLGQDPMTSRPLGVKYHLKMHPKHARFIPVETRASNPNPRPPARVPQPITAAAAPILPRIRGTLSARSANLLHFINTTEVSLKQTQHAIIAPDANTYSETAAPNPQPTPPVRQTPRTVRQSPPAYQATAPSTAVVPQCGTGSPGHVTATTGISPNPVAGSVSKTIASTSSIDGVPVIDLDESPSRNENRLESLATVQRPTTSSSKKSENPRLVGVVIPVLKPADDRKCDGPESEGDGSSVDESESEDDVSSTSLASSSDESSSSFVPEGPKKAKTVSNAFKDPESSDSDQISSSASTTQSTPEARTPPSSPPSQAYSKASIATIPDVVSGLCPICKRQGMLSMYNGEILLVCQEHAIQVPLHRNMPKKSDAQEPLRNGRGTLVSEQAPAEFQPPIPSPSMGMYSLKRCQQRANGATESESESDIPVQPKKRRFNRGRHQV